jgi:hypothetical protein
MRQLLLSGVMGWAVCRSLLGAASVQDPMEQYDVVWNTPSQGPSGSMPIGNGDIGINLWVEASGDLLFYIGKTDSWSENGRLLKLGRVRLRLSPNPYGKDLPFKQTLRLRQGAIDILAGKKDSQVRLAVWVDANHPVIRVEVNGQQDLDVNVSLELWRQKERQLALTSGSADDAVDGLGKDIPAVVYPDHILKGAKGQVVWYHRNEKSLWPVTLKLQGLEGFMQHATDPLLNRTFGAALQGEGLINDGPTTLKSTKTAKHYVLSIYPLTQQTATAEEWRHELDGAIEQTEKVPLEQAREEHRRWWEQFWSRSWIRVSGTKDAGMVSQGYALQRFINACGGRGFYPVKFNGSIFTVDVAPIQVAKLPSTTTYEVQDAGRRNRLAGDPDFRRWGGAYWFQNTRLVYWPMLASGDYDLMQPFFRMYLETLPLSKERTKVYFGHSGVFFPETMYFWGAYINMSEFGYGWNREGRPVSFVDNPWIRYHWEGGLELSTILIDYYSHTQDKTFLHTIVVPVVEGILEFYDKHYKRDNRGRLHFEPAQSLETYQTAVNPLPEIAGLRFILEKLLALPDEAINKEQRRKWQRLLEGLPSLPTRQINNETILAPAETFADLRNVENPELYAIFPFRLYGVGKPDLEMARFTFQVRQFVKLDDGMTQDPVQAALLGLAETARDYAVHYFRNRDHGSRFPAFWDAGGDWVPNQCLGGNAMMALQTMLLQAEDRKIFLLPAWPKAWDVEFKLHAPYGTTLEGVYKAGKLEKLRVIPESRTTDVIRLEPQ